LYSGILICLIKEETSYSDFKSKTNAVILLDLGYMLRGEHIQEE
jgi:hypothetical protein